MVRIEEDSAIIKRTWNDSKKLKEKLVRGQFTDKEV
jgi:hypothetical protein